MAAQEDGYSTYRKSDMKEERADFLIGEIVGHRCWVRADGFLYSPWSGTGWPNNEAVVMARYDGIPPLRFHGSDGIYAFKTYEDLRTKVLIQKEKMDWLVQHWRRHCKNFRLEIGTIEMWGTVVEHRDGWRAQYAAVLSIDQIRHLPDFMRE
jgi:hypothetical protein